MIDDPQTYTTDDENKDTTENPTSTDDQEKFGAINTEDYEFDEETTTNDLEE